MAKTTQMSDETRDTRLLSRCARGYDWNTFNDSEYMYFGSSNDASLSYDGTNNLLKVSLTSPAVFSVGAFSSSTVGSGIAISSTRTKAFDVLGDDGGVALTAGSYQVIRGRMLVKTAITTGDISINAVLGHTKIAVNTATGSYTSGVRGYVEVGGLFSTTSAAGVRGMVDIPTGATIASGAVVSALQADSNDLTGTHTGKAVAVSVPNPVAGTWDAFASFGSATGCLAGNTTRGADADSLLIIINGTTFKIPVYADA
jgi:hypothetical protein